MNKFLIPPEDEEIKNAFILVFSIIGDYEKKDVLLVTPTKNSMHLEGLNKVLGARRVNQLKNNQNVIIDGISLRLESLQTFNISDPRNSVILGIYTGKAMLDKIDDSNADATIIVPSIINEPIQNWIDTWNPKIYGEENKLGDEKKLIDNCIVEKALKNISFILKRPHTSEIMIRSTNDKELTVDLFKILFKYGEYFDPEAIRKWAVREGWTSEGADELKDISQKILAGKRIKGSQIPTWSYDNLKEWRNNCN